MKHLDYNILVISTGVLAGTSNLFAYCYLGKMATHSYENMAKCLYDCNWHELSPKLQKYIVVMMANAQRPVYYDGFGVAVLNLETFTKVRNGRDSSRPNQLIGNNLSFTDDPGRVFVLHDFQNFGI